MMFIVSYHQSAKLTGVCRAAAARLVLHMQLLMCVLPLATSGTGGALVLSHRLLNTFISVCKCV